MAILLSNLLDNAIEAEKLQTEKQARYAFKNVCL